MIYFAEKLRTCAELASESLTPARYACGAALRRINRKLEKFNCKKCGSAAVKDEYAGEWD